MPRISRRKFLATVMLAAPGTALADATCVEPTWLRTNYVRFGTKPPQHRFVQFSDTHHKGDREYLAAVIKQINSLAPDFACFTGDILEDKKYLTEALELFSGISVPLYGVPGNHDYWSRISFTPVHKCFNATGGAWLVDEHRKVAGGKINLIGVSCMRAGPLAVPTDPELINIMLMHYPAWVNQLKGTKFDLMLAGHTHGGQVRIPFFGPLIVPYGAGGYDMGRFETASGPLYVNPGIGYLYGYDFRFNCRPEITVIEI